MYIATPSALHLQELCEQGAFTGTPDMHLTLPTSSMQAIAVKKRHRNATRRDSTVIWAVMRATVIATSATLNSCRRQVLHTAA